MTEEGFRLRISLTDSIRVARQIAGIAALLTAGCGGFGAARSADCSAKINRCVEACANKPTTLERRQQAMAHQTQAPASCEERCDRC